ncbi:hypothetical protein K439DRAFT_1662805 [Ramaria rubella]|nr:hypothetical protein K439DRAFT_1662805 [Ramaria rubella]
MTNWNDPATVQHQSVIFGNVIHFVTGVYAWEIAVNIRFDWSIISGKRRFRWPMVLYFACRYLMLFALVGILIALNATSELNCQALYTFNQFAGNAAIGLASTLFMLRTIAVWHRSYYATVPLVIICLGQWAILLRGMTQVIAVWNPIANQCVVTASGKTFLDLIYFYTMSFDLTVLILTSIGLYLSPARFSLWKLLFSDGIIFFIVATVSNTFPAVFIALNLNAVMNIMFTAPAAGVAAIFSCRSFVRVTTYSSSEVYVKSDGNSGSVASHVSARIGDFKNHRTRMPREPGTTAFDPDLDLGYHTNTVNAVNSGALDEATALGNGAGVHILMETFSESDPTDDDTKKRDSLEDGYVHDISKPTMAHAR